VIFVVVMLIPAVIITVITRNQIESLGIGLSDIAITDATTALNNDARENLERMTTGTASRVADFLYQRDQDLLLLAKLMPSDEAYMVFSESRNSNLMTMGEWKLSEDGMSWVEVDPFIPDGSFMASSNNENNDELPDSGLNYRPPELFNYYHELLPLYDEITFIDLDGQELFKYVSIGTTKTNYPMNIDKVDVSNKSNTYVKAETYWDEIQNLKPGEVYVSSVIGAYVGTNYIGMYTPGMIEDNVSESHPNYAELLRIAGLPANEFIEAAKQQAFAGMENPVGQRFEAIIRWITPVVDFDGEIWGYVTMALNHDFIMEFVDFITPTKERYSVLSDAQDDNYASIRDYKNRSIAHPRHHLIAGYDPLTGEPQEQGLEDSLIPIPDSTQEYTGWMELTENGGSGSFYVSGENFHKITTAGAISYYTGKYSPQVQGNGRGFAFVTINSGIEDFTESAVLTEERLIEAINENLHENMIRLIGMGIGVFALILAVAILLASLATAKTGQEESIITSNNKFKEANIMVKGMKIALQLYTVRDVLDDDFRGILQKVKDMGYEGVEFAGMPNYPPAEIQSILSEIGLEPLSAHVPIAVLSADPAGVVSAFKEIGCKFVAVPYLEEADRPGKNNWDKIKADIAKVASECKKQGMTLLYHNHDFEFVKDADTGEYALDQLYREIPELETQVDVCWVKVAGEDPAAYVRKYKGRAPVVHLKDFMLEGEKGGKMYELIGIENEEEEKSGKFEFRPLGHGLQDIPSLVDAAADAGAGWVVVEQDFPSMGKTSLECAQMGIETLKGIQ